MIQHNSWLLRDQLKKEIHLKTDSHRTHFDIRQFNQFQMNFLIIQEKIDFLKQKS